MAGLVTVAENKEIAAMVSMMDSLVRVVTARNVTEEFSLQRLQINNVRAELSHGVCYTNVDVNFDVIDRTTVPKKSVGTDGITLWEMQVITIHAKHTFWHHVFWRHPSKLDEARMVRKLLFDGIIHEIDECLTVNGERPFDPHKVKMPRRWWFAALKHRLFGRKDDP